ncbi:MAG: hypothetical protein ACOYK1_00695 [Vampirovibrionia bacterium]
MRLTFFRYRLCDVVNRLCGASRQTFNRQTLKDQLVGEKGNKGLEDAIDEITNNSDDTYLSESEVAQKLSKHFSFKRTENNVTNQTLLEKIDGLNGKTNFDLNDYRSNESKKIGDCWKEANAHKAVDAALCLKETTNTEPGLLADAVKKLGGTTTKKDLFEYFQGVGKLKTGENYFKLSERGGPSNRDLARIIDMLPSDGITQKSLDDLFKGPNSSTSQKTTKNIFYDLNKNEFVYKDKAEEMYVPTKQAAKTPATQTPALSTGTPKPNSNDTVRVPLPQYDPESKNQNKEYYEARKELRSAFRDQTRDKEIGKEAFVSLREDLDLINTAMNVGVRLNRKS